jgi:hypothetical protein
LWGKVEYGNKNYIWFLFIKFDMYLVPQVLLSLWYAGRFSMGTHIFYFHCMGFMNIMHNFYNTKG